MDLKKVKYKDIFLPCSALVFFIIVWQLAASAIGNPFTLPSFTDTMGSLYYMLFERGSIFEDIGTSLLHFAMGMAASLIVGITVGAAMGWFESFSKFINPIIELLRPIPPLAWIPFAIIWFGLSDFASGFIIFMGSVFPTLVNTYTGFRNVPKIYLEAGRVLGCRSNMSLIRKVAFPAAYPSIIAGIRVSMGVGWMCLVGAEIFGAGSAKYGLGLNLWNYYNLHMMPNVVVYMLILGCIGIAIDMAFRWYVNRQTEIWKNGA